MLEINNQFQSPEVWQDTQKSLKLNQEKKQLEVEINQFDELTNGIDNLSELLKLVLEENEPDPEMVQELESDYQKYTTLLEKIELNRMFDNPLDRNDCFIDFQAGSGGTEAQDWAQMIERMVLRYCESKRFLLEVLDRNVGEVAGIKSASYKIQGLYAYGSLRTETGIHRLVRKSPFDANNKRHTSFASIFVYPVVEDNLEVEINTADLRIDTYRASGAGGQHINRTDSAVRITHLPTNTVVQCQNDRSQHRNKAEAMLMLKAKLYELEMRKRSDQQQKLKDNKTAIGWGHQIRSYVLDQSRIKDERTGIEIGNTTKVLDGWLDPFIEESLKNKL